MIDNYSVCVDDVTLEFRSDTVDYSNHLFIDKNGENVYSGDCVSFPIVGEVYPHYGVVHGGDRLKICCYNQIMNTIKVYFIDESSTGGV